MPNAGGIGWNNGGDLMQYTKQDLTRMQEIIAYSAQDAHDNQDKETYRWLTETIGLLEGLIEKAVI